MKRRAAWFPALLLLAAGICGAKAAERTPSFDTSKSFDELTHAEKSAAKAAARVRKLHTLRVCADPGNMPLSGENRNGYQNKVIDVLARAMHTKIVYFWRPYIERGLTRDTFTNDECDVLLDLPADYEGALTTVPIYRSTYVLATREADHLAIKDLDDPRLKKLRIGVFQHSGIRLAFAEHGVRNVEIHIISHDADLEPDKQPWRQVQEVIDGKLDLAAVWGPFAGWLKTLKHEPIAIQPINLMDGKMPLEFDLAIGVRKTDVVLKYMLDNALDRSKDEIKQILTDYGVPLVRCSKCVVSGDIPSHGSYFTQSQEITRSRFLKPLPASRTTLDPNQASKDQLVTKERVDQWLKDGADLNQELGNAVLASDHARVEALLAKGADINAQNLQGYPPLHMAARQRDSDMVTLLLKHGADPNSRDSDGWTALAHAAFRNHVPSIQVLIAGGAGIEMGPPGFTPLAIALSEGKFFAAKALIDAGSSVNAPSGKDRLTPLMLIAAQKQVDRRAAIVAQGPSSVEIARLLISKGADLNAASTEGVTPLMVAAAHDNPPLIGVLLQSGAAADVKTPAGKTALDIAKNNQNAAAIQQLELLARSQQKRDAVETDYPAEQNNIGQ